MTKFSSDDEQYFLSYRRQWRTNKDGSGTTSKWESVRSLWRSQPTSIGKQAFSKDILFEIEETGKLYFRGFYFDYNKMYREYIP